MNIGITLKPNAYTPEAFAYQEYLENRGHSIQLDYELDVNNDINIYFMGLRPFWSNKKIKALEVHEYQSLSIPPYSKLKDKIKTLVNVKPDGRIFLNKRVNNDLNFNDSIPFIERDMGVDNSLFQIPKANAEYDIVYSGSITGRVGLVDALVKLSIKNKIIVVGEVEENIRLVFKKNNIEMTGRVDRKNLPEIYANARYGLNYTPDIYPFNIQTSTKTLEYLASGLTLITNRYPWVESFCSNLNYQPIWLEDLRENDELILKVINTPNMEKYSWNYILKDCNFDDFLKSLLAKKGV
ncbi:glycosyl transferase [Acinetobacter baumannii]|uniref:glycosyltransferase family protein n=1 Tax=Acinetobacter calcoaceticus/baumannii complex TaxID=909768 RepID=UPI001023CA35|nr:glycosyl transferase [Acinetobacter pittii]RZH08325.1 glycosyl transferase [Acinetobacter pittii]